MALFDWNGNKKNDIDDDFFEFMIFQEMMKEDNEKMPRSSYRSGGISTFGAIVGTVLTMLIAAAICVFFGLDGVDSPLVTVVYVILCVVIGVPMALFFDSIGL